MMKQKGSVIGCCSHRRMDLHPGCLRCWERWCHTHQEDIRLSISHILNLSEKIREGIQADLKMACEKEEINGLSCFCGWGLESKWGFLKGLIFPTSASGGTSEFSYQLAQICHRRVRWFGGVLKVISGHTSQNGIKTVNYIGH